MSATSVEAGTATERYLDFLAERAEKAAHYTGEASERAYRNLYLPGAFALAVSLVRGEGAAIGVDSEFEASRSLGITRDAYRNARLFMIEHLQHDLTDESSAWTYELDEAGRQVVREQSRLPGFDRVEALAREMADREESLRFAARAVFDALADPQQ